MRSVVLKRSEVDSLDVYPFSIPAIRQLDELTLDPQVTLFAGENGSYVLSSDGITQTPYEETEVVEVTRSFLGAREAFLHHLFED